VGDSGVARSALRRQTEAGARHRTSVCFGHEFDADLFVDAVDDLVRAEQ
jgi:hypothetical protein